MRRKHQSSYKQQTNRTCRGFSTFLLLMVLCSGFRIWRPRFLTQQRLRDKESEQLRRAREKPGARASPPPPPSVLRFFFCITTLCSVFCCFFFFCAALQFFSISYFTQWCVRPLPHHLLIFLSLSQERTEVGKTKQPSLCLSLFIFFLQPADVDPSPDKRRKSLLGCGTPWRRWCEPHRRLS